MSSLVIWRGISPSRDLEISSTVSSTGEILREYVLQNGQIDVFVDSERLEIVFGKLGLTNLRVIKNIHRIVADNLDLLPVALYINDVYAAVLNGAGFFFGNLVSRLAKLNCLFPLCGIDINGKIFRKGIGYVTGAVVAVAHNSVGKRQLFC